MTILHLSSQKYAIGLELPASSVEVTRTLSALREGAGRASPIQIVDVSSPIPNLHGYIHRADLENEVDLQKLNTLAERIAGMSQQEHQLFSGALDAESVSGLDDVLRIAGGLEQYEFLSGITNDRALGGWLMEHRQLDVDFPEKVWPYLDYAAIGAEYYSNHGGAYTPNGYVKHRTDAPVQEEAPRAILLALTTSEQNYPLALPASDQQLEQAKRALGIEEFAQVRITAVKFSASCLADLLPLDAVSVEDANTLAECLQEMEQEDGELRKYCAVLEVEQPDTFSEALNIAMDRDDYECVPEDMDEYGRQVLRRAGADDEIIDTIDGYTNFAQLGADSMEEDGVRRTDFGLVRRLSQPFPEQPEFGMQMQ